VSDKNLYLLGLQESSNRQPDIHEMIRNLEDEIALGEDVYTSTELSKLEQKLYEYREFLRIMTKA
jgi:hypothetical protein